MTGATSPVAALGGQTYVESRPFPALSKLVSSTWIQQVHRDADPYLHRRVPNGAVEVVCKVGSPPQVVGPLTEPLVEVIEPGSTIVGVRFVPGAFAEVARQPVSEVVGLVIDAGDLWGRATAALGEAVSNAITPTEALKALQLEVQQRAGADATPDPVVSEAVRGLMRWGTASVASVTASLYMSETQLRRRCGSAVGLAPKALHRMLRFQGVLARIQQSIAKGHPPTEDGLASLAVQAGYADQSHLTRECVRLTGVSPRVFIAETRQACSCGHDHAASFAPVLSAGRAVTA